MLEGLSSPSNRPILPYYLDFVLSSLPYLRCCFRSVLLPIIRCFREQLILSLQHLEASTSSAPQKSNAVDMEIILILNGLEKITLFCASDAKWDDFFDGHGKENVDNSYYGLRGLTDLVTGVFVGDTSESTGLTDEKMKEMLLALIVEIMTVVEKLWMATNMEKSMQAPAKEDIAYQIQPLNTRIRYRIRKFMDAVYRIYAVDFVEMISELWFAANANVDNLDVCHERANWIHCYSW